MIWLEESSDREVGSSVVREVLSRIGMSLAVLLCGFAIVALLYGFLLLFGPYLNN